VTRAGDGWHIAGEGVFIRKVDDAANKTDESEELENWGLSVPTT
jgi:hypothetical protein